MWHFHAVTIVATLWTCHAAGYDSFHWQSHLQDIPSASFDYLNEHTNHNHYTPSQVQSWDTSHSELLSQPWQEIYDHTTFGEPGSSNWEDTLASHHGRYIAGANYQEHFQSQRPAYSPYPSLHPAFAGTAAIPEHVLWNEIDISVAVHDGQWEASGVDIASGSGEEVVEQQQQQQQHHSIDARRAVRAQSTTDVLRNTIIGLMKRKGVWVGMIPRELAAAINEIKLELGSEQAQSVGQLASVILRKDPMMNSQYAEEVQDWQKKYTHKTSRLFTKFRRPSLGLSAEQIRAAVYLNARLLQSREEYVRSVRKRERGEDEEKIEADQDKRADREAVRAWLLLLERSIHPKLGQVADGDVPMAFIEEESRDLQLPHSSYSLEEVADFLRRYLMKVLHKSPKEVDVFYKARNRWLKGLARAER